jgi:phage-related protein
MSNALAHIPIKGEIKIDLNKAFTMEGLYEIIQTSYPKDPTLTVVGIAIPIVNVQCKGLGIIDPIGDIKEAISRLYTQAMQSIIKPIWDLLHKIMDVLKRVFSFILDYKLPIFDLTINDLFAPDLYDKIKAKVIEMYANAKDQLIKLLKLLEIPWPLFKNLESPEKAITAIIESIIRSLWSFVLKMITKIIGLIKTALDLWDRIVNKGLTILGLLWQQAIDTVLGFVLDLIINPPTMETIMNWIIEWAKKVLNKAIVTFEEIMRIIKDFKIPILNIRPFDWKIPLNPNLSFPDVDFAKILIDIKTWINNWLISIITKFINAILEIINKILSIDFSLPVLTIPLTLCAVKNTTS